MAWSSGGQKSAALSITTVPEARLLGFPDSGRMCSTSIARVSVRGRTHLDRGSGVRSIAVIHFPAWRTRHHRTSEHNRHQSAAVVCGKRKAVVLHGAITIHVATSSSRPKSLSSLYKYKGLSLGTFSLTPTPAKVPAAVPRHPSITRQTLLATPHNAG